MASCKMKIKCSGPLPENTKFDGCFVLDGDLHKSSKSKSCFFLRGTSTFGHNLSEVDKLQSREKHVTQKKQKYIGVQHD